MASHRTVLSLDLTPPTVIDKIREIQKGDTMNGPIWLILGIGLIFTASPTWAQRYDPKYPVCMEVSDGDGGRIECLFTTMAQCKEGTQGGVAGLCLNNPYYVVPAPEAPPATQTTPAPSASPAGSPRH
jgi:hypothetical protein